MHVYFFCEFFPACMLLLPMHIFIFFQNFDSLHFFQNITYIEIDLIWTNGCVKTEFVWCRSNFYIIIWHKSSVKIAYLHLHVYYFFKKNPPYTVISSCTFIDFSKKILHTRLFPHARLFATLEYWHTYVVILGNCIYSLNFSIVIRIMWTFSLCLWETFMCRTLFRCSAVVSL